jgi:hypothetical protein
MFWTVFSMHIFETILTKSEDVGFTSFSSIVFEANPTFYGA